MNEYEEDTWSKYIYDNGANVGNMFPKRCIQVRRPLRNLSSDLETRGQ